MVRYQFESNLVERKDDLFCENTDPDMKIKKVKEELADYCIESEVTYCEIEGLDEKIACNDVRIKENGTEYNYIKEEHCYSLGFWSSNTDCAGNIETEEDILYENDADEKIKEECINYDVSLSSDNFKKHCSKECENSFTFTHSSFQRNNYSLPDNSDKDIKIEVVKEELREDCNENVKATLVTLQDEDYGENVERCYKASKRDFESDERISIEEKLIQYDFCSSSFTRLRFLKTHGETHRTQKPKTSKKKKYKCEVCLKYFLNISALVVHHRIHTGEKPYKCNVCSKSFSTKTVLVVHFRIHTGIKAYKCEICSKSFIQSCTLKRHFKTIHTGEKPYKCEICAKSFSESSKLKTHFRIHTGEKPYKCKVCLKSFSTNSILVVHSRIHSGQTTYKCEICLKSFFRSSTLKKHVKTIHTDEKP